MLTSTSTSVRREASVLLPPTLVLLAVLQLCTRHDAGHRELAGAALAVLVTQVLPGAVVWRLVRPVHGWLVEDLVMGLAVGAALSVPFHVVGVAADQPWLAAALPLAMAGVLVAWPVTRERIASREVVALPWAWGTVVAACAIGPLLSLISSFGNSPLRWKGWASFYVDVPYHDALTSEVMHHFPPHYPQVAQEPLAYHWFTHAWTAQIATVSGTPVDVLLWRFNPSLLLVAAPLVLAFAAMRLSGLTWAGPAAALLAFLMPNVTPWADSRLSTPLHTIFSPTQQFSVLLLGALVTLLTFRWRGDAARGSGLLLLLLVVITGGTKGSALPVVVAGCGLALVAAAVLRSRERIRTIAVDTALAGITLLVLNKVMFGGGDGGLTLDLGHDYLVRRAPGILGPDADPTSAAGVVAAALTLLPLLLGPGAAFALLALRDTRRDPTVWLLFGAGGAGVAAIVLLTHPGQSQGYFYRAGEPFIALAGAWGTALLASRVARPRSVVLAGGAIGAVSLCLTLLAFADGEKALGLTTTLLALAVFGALVAGGSAVVARATGTAAAGGVATAAVALVFAGTLPAVTSITELDPAPRTVSAKARPGAIAWGDVEALRWLGRAAGDDDVVITNDHCRAQQADPCDRRRFFVGAFAERRVLIEGWTYNRRVSGYYEEHGPAIYTDSMFWDQPLLALNDGFIAAPDATAARQLWDLGVRWVVVWARAPHAADLAPYATPERRGPSLRIYRLAPPA